ncbi:hypothetical protein J7J47_03685 [Halomonas sp. ISL-60]|uniref:hypothetical protein n=1 Tax=Halomonas sp. ISL-56 TaxID=2819149 RepID=UPI001BEB70A3|nr:hypothetical protein [Halomonas sp. ISL-56]MBT2771331.1 hypothetical protein [Halomonas sp. ISL-60]MBT2800688.1 hypothetical protein [Halomonas sp. ISL-56]
MFELLLLANISQPYFIAALIAALVRILILLKQPPPPRPTYVEMGRQSALTLILVASSEPIALLLSIDPNFATIVGISVALHGTDSVVSYIKSLIKTILPEKLQKAFEEVDNLHKQQEAERVNKAQLKKIEEQKAKEKQADIETEKDDETI